MPYRQRLSKTHAGGARAIRFKALRVTLHEILMEIRANDPCKSIECVRVAAAIVSGFTIEQIFNA